ncbi:ABC transporter permease [Thermoleophilia bacterium SCSIO 60948]|nr:ABC transporter permease [Thermoleophilia bacterium SCSIO 60948]
MSTAREVALETGLNVERQPPELRRRFFRLPYPERIAIGAFIAILLISILGPLLATNNPTEPVGAPFTQPGDGFIFGTDELGNDIFTRILYGLRQSLLGAFAVTLSGVLIGTAVGLIAGATRGWVDTVLMRITDAFLALPAPVLALAVAAALGRSYINTLIAVAAVFWALYARIVRAEVRAFASRPYIEAARLSGVPARRLWIKHLLPGAVPVILVAASLDIGGLILLISGLSFLGLGAPQPAPELGAMVAQGLPFILSSSWVALIPALAIFAIALVCNLAGDAVRDMLEE